LEADAVPCEECGGYASPTEDVYPEKIRYWAQVMEAPSAVVEALMKYDDEGTRYLTQVAQRLLQLASIGDEGIRDAYMVEHVA
jgi:hypothetical protein